MPFSFGGICLCVSSASAYDGFYISLPFHLSLSLMGRRSWCDPQRDENMKACMSKCSLKFFCSITSAEKKKKKKLNFLPFI